MITKLIWLFEMLLGTDLQVSAWVDMAIHSPCPCSSPPSLGQALNEGRTLSLKMKLTCAFSCNQEQQHKMGCLLRAGVVFFTFEHQSVYHRSGLPPLVVILMLMAGTLAGFNCGEAANFATPGWLEVAKEAAARRAAMNYLPMLSHQQLLYLLTMSLPPR